MKYSIGIVIVGALISQTDIVKEFFGDATASLSAFQELADLYNNVEPKERWTAEKCEKVNTIVTSYCSGVCNDGTSENCDADCRSDFETEFQCDQFPK